MAIFAAFRCSNVDSKLCSSFRSKFVLNSLLTSVLCFVRWECSHLTHWESSVAPPSSPLVTTLMFCSIRWVPFGFCCVLRSPISRTLTWRTRINSTKSSPELRSHSYGSYGQNFLTLNSHACVQKGAFNDQTDLTVSMSITCDGLHYFFKPKVKSQSFWCVMISKELKKTRGTSSEQQEGGAGGEDDVADQMVICLRRMQLVNSYFNQIMMNIRMLHQREEHR